MGLMLSSGLKEAPAADHRATATGTNESRQTAQFLSIGIGKSVVIDLPRDLKDLLIADPKIANAIVRSTQRAYIIGVAVGQTSIVFFDAAGQQIVAYDIAVTRDLNGIRYALRQALAQAKIRVDGVGDGVMLSGLVSSPVEAQQAGDVAAKFVGSAEKVVNNIVVQGRDQVMLKVTVAEVGRNIVKQLGIDLSANLTYGTSVVKFTNSNPFTAYGRSLVEGNSLTSTVGGVTTTMRALESAGFVRTLAEPNLTAISGESATFVAGGEFPVPGGYSCDPSTHVCTTQISFKKFGISLNFTPVVLSAGRISLRIMSEVSELSNDNAITLTQSGSSLTVPSIKTRRAETTLEIPSGGALAMAGLIQEQTKRAVNGFPGLNQLPVLGSLFRSQDYVNNQTELLILVTPLIVRAVAQNDLSRPGDGFVDASDPQAALLGTINKLYGVPGQAKPAQNYHGSFGFITD
ncbi:type II and III secretion system protein family protein [Bradyrhizobium sp. 200]|uniref:type II and III secretion system protein family protein n=1 Tax=Bradyrhizobium sp. 200 TaxID=2782665 RepID=UPI0020002296|nr:type II and III secretion system protein family protein [Bradyrhizobium sp. 200]